MRQNAMVQGHILGRAGHLIMTWKERDRDTGRGYLFLPCPLLLVAGILTLRAAMGRVCSGAVPPVTSSIYLVPASLLAWSSLLEQEDLGCPE